MMGQIFPNFIYESIFEITTISGIDLSTKKAENDQRRMKEENIGRDLITTDLIDEDDYDIEQAKNFHLLWNVTEHTSTFLIIQLNYKHPYLISKYESDTLQIFFKSVTDEIGFFKSKSTRLGVLLSEITDIPGCPNHSSCR